MLKNLHVTNFKSHRDTKISLGNLTLLTGTNSAGKSSLIHALLLLRQSFIKDRLTSGLDLNEPLCRMGVGQDVLYRWAETGIMSIAIYDGESISFDFDAGKALGGTFLPKCDCGAAVSRDALEASPLFNDDFQYVSSLRIGGKSHFEQYDYEVSERRQISKSFGQGECVAHFLDRFGTDPSTNYLFDGKDYALADQVELWMRRISEGITVEIKKSATGGFDIEYGYAFEGLKPLTGLRAENIGYGISHSLPVIVALVSAKPGSLIVLENPETHLHPAGQAELAKLISRVAQSGVQVIVETHSDHILNGVLVAAKSFEDESPKERRGGLDRKNVKIYYIDKEPDTLTYSVATEVAVKSGGRVDWQPKGFFDQAERDLGFLMGI